CKALGKAIILSDLEVHFEHQYGIYFQRSNAEDLAQKISALLPVSQPGPDKRREAEARLQAAGLAAAYGREFCRLATEAQAIFARKTVSPALPQTAASLPDTKLITLATSLRVTEDPRNQHKAIASWLKLGFQVISVNAAEDISTLAPIFPSVRFIAAERDVIRQNGTCIYYDELLSVLDRYGTKICGLAEPDTYFCQKPFHSLIAREAPCSLIYGSTIDIEALSAPKASSPPRFGFCFFDRQLIPYYPAEDFRIGLPWWDYWAVLIAAARNFTLKKLADPVAFRVRETAPDLEDWVSFGNRLAKYAPPTCSLSAATLTNYAQQLSVILGKRSKTVLS
ncbi:MAG: hypothetical protein N3D19_00510, partial [Archaeoglobaceae archaeon]|nr:hypothetical protein [Archaeoglobaceae archaeon]